MRVSGPFLESDVVLFDEGVDFLAEPSDLDGRWQEVFSSDLSRRVERSDTIAVVQVDALGTEQGPDGLKTYLLTASPEEVLKGGLSGPITLSAPQGSPGFGSIERSRARLLKERFTAFIRFYERDGGTVGAHFHLSPASEGVLGAVRTQLLPPSQSQVIRVIR